MRVLIVDDQADIREALCDLLTDEGYACIVASGGREALSAVAEGKPPDLVLTDLMMPGMTGLELAAQLHRLHPAVPVVLITAIGRDGLPSRPPGIVHVLHKPFDLDVLMSTVARYAPISR